MNEYLEKLEKIHEKSLSILHEFNKLPEKDIRRTHLEILSSQLIIAAINLRINYRFAEANEAEFGSLFDNNKEQIENYKHNIVQVMNESIADAALFQTELVFRFLYSKISGGNVGEEKNLHRIFATLFDDVENNWKKEETKAILLLWNLRNTIHTGGIFFNKPDGLTLNFKGKNYEFEYGKAPEFLLEGHFLDLISELLDSLKYVFSNEPIKSMSSFSHPSYYALGYTE